ncbi:MAG: phosphodiester glycosidase family protein [Chthoniobacterales bacterium]
MAGSEPKTSGEKLVQHWETKVVNAPTGEKATIHAAIFSMCETALRVIDQPGDPRRSLAATMPATKALAGVNGGYFDPDDAPVGLLVSDGRVISPQRKAKLLAGVIFTRGDRVEIVRSSAFAMSAKIKNAVQCGPFLVEHSKSVVGLNGTRRARRTFAGVDGEGRAVLGICSSVSLSELGQILAVPGAAGKIKLARAINLDGGSSSAFWFAGGGDSFSQSEFKPVRNFLAVVPRGDR